MTVDAAQQLFVANGFGGTTIAAVAREAGVSAPTVYAGFGTKAELLRSAIDLALAGDDEPVAVADRPPWVCNAPELYVWLTSRRRWSTKRYVSWARNSLLKLVVEPPAGDGALPSFP